MKVSMECFLRRSAICGHVEEDGLYRRTGGGERGGSLISDQEWGIKDDVDGEAYDYWKHLMSRSPSYPPDE